MNQLPYNSNIWYSYGKNLVLHTVLFPRTLSFPWIRRFRHCTREPSSIPFTCNPVNHVFHILKLFLLSCSQWYKTWASYSVLTSWTRWPTLSSMFGDNTRCATLWVSKLCPEKCPPGGSPITWSATGNTGRHLCGLGPKGLGPLFLLLLPFPLSSMVVVTAIPGVALGMFADFAFRLSILLCLPAYKTQLKRILWSFPW